MSGYTSDTPCLPDCEYEPGHVPAHPCGKKPEQPGDLCRFCGKPVPDPPPCPECWTPIHLRWTSEPGNHGHEQGWSEVTMDRHPTPPCSNCNDTGHVCEALRQGGREAPGTRQAARGDDPMIIDMPPDLRIPGGRPPDGPVVTERDPRGRRFQFALSCLQGAAQQLHHAVH